MTTHDATCSLARRTRRSPPLLARPVAAAHDSLSPVQDSLDGTLASFSLCPTLLHAQDPPFAHAVALSTSACRPLTARPLATSAPPTLRTHALSPLCSPSTPAPSAPCICRPPPLPLKARIRRVAHAKALLGRMYAHMQVNWRRRTSLAEPIPPMVSVHSDCLSPISTHSGRRRLLI